MRNITGTFGISVHLLRSVAFSRNCPVKFPHPQKQLLVWQPLTGPEMWPYAMRQADQILSYRSLKSGFREQWLELVKQLMLSENLWDGWYENSHSVVETGRKSIPLLRKGWEMGSLLGLELGDEGEALEEIGRWVCGKNTREEPLISGLWRNFGSREGIWKIWWATCRVTPCSGLCMTSSVKGGKSLIFLESRLLFLDGAEPYVSAGVE